MRANRHACFTMTSAVARHREIRHSAAQTFDATRLLQYAIPILAEFVARPYRSDSTQIVTRLQLVGPLLLRVLVK